MNVAVMSRSEQKKQQILLAAKELFCGQGFANTSMDEVAKLAGVSKQTVYSHYGCKDDLFVASIESKCLINGVNQEMLSDPAIPEDNLTKFAQHFADVVVSSEAITVFKACVAQADTHPEISHLFYSAGPENMLRILTDYLKSVALIGRYQFDNPQHCAVRFCLMIFGEMRMKLELGLDVADLIDDRTEYINGSVNMFLNAYRVRSGS
ncbi:TetR/AcrR family transcriptional regulator [Shewanella youngdeokensis]|uniref:TetR/AcrR family transcriptional regulator n=1 Tax=Shewanella youngdeokensis TaxID=2999068 RepID=A0ABZ0K362_9GAMM|nr:TetR/AcrR family transcriptional regulator [Shewanella sp. DAU334]